MTTRYKQERYEGRDKREAVTNALKVSIPSIIVSAMGLFSATFGVALYSDVDIISSLCDLMARGCYCKYVCCYPVPAGHVHAVRQDDLCHQHRLPEQECRTLQYIERKDGIRL